MKSVSPQHTYVSPERAKHLERNRMAANKCRERKKNEHKKIERRYSDEIERKGVLLAQLDCLREEIWDLKNIIFQHAECEDQQINLQLATMSQTILDSQSKHNPRYLPTFSSGLLDGSVGTDDDYHNMIEDVYDGNESTVLPEVADGLIMPYDPNGYAGSMFDNFVNAENMSI